MEFILLNIYITLNKSSYKYSLNSLTSTNKMTENELFVVVVGNRPRQQTSNNKDTSDITSVVSSFSQRSSAHISSANSQIYGKIYIFIYIYTYILIYLSVYIPTYSIISDDL